MRPLLSYARSIFWIDGIVQILIGLYSAIASLIRPQSSLPVPIGLLGLVIAAFGVLSCLAARALRHRKRGARPLVAVNSVLSLLMFPFGTVAGAVGLYWCFSKSARELEPLVEDFEYRSKPGDGTQAWLQKASTAVSIIVWVASMSAASWWGHSHGLPRTGAINGLLLVLICDWIAALFHEVGHALAGSLVDMTLARFAVGPLVAEKRAGRWTFQLSLAAMLSAGGSVAAQPLHVRDLRRRMAVEIAGGPLASLFTALVAFAILLAAPGSSWQAWWKFPAVVGAMSAAGFVLNLIPFACVAGFSDGALLVQLLRGGPFADLREALKMVAATMVTATRPRDLDPRALAQGRLAATGGHQEGMLRMIELICAVDRGEMALAREHLEAALMQIPEPAKAGSAGTAAEMALYIAFLDGSALRAAEWLRGAEQMPATAGKPLAEDFDYCLARAAIRRAEAKVEEAEAAWQQATRIANRRPSTGLYQYDRELLERVRTSDWLRAEQVA